MEPAGGERPPDNRSREVPVKREDRRLEAREVAEVRISDVHRDSRPWHTRVVVRMDDVQSLAKAIESTGHVVPIRLVPRPEGGYDYVTGLYRLLAVELLGYETIPAYVEDSADEEVLLRTAVADQEVRFPLKTLERGWAIERLLRLRAARGHPSLQTDLAGEIGLDEGVVSTCLAAAKSVPIEHAREVEQHHGLSDGAIATLARSPLRKIARAESPEERSRLLDVAGEALARGRSATRAVREALNGAEADDAQRDATGTSSQQQARPEGDSNQQQSERQEPGRSRTPRILDRVLEELAYEYEEIVDWLRRAADWLRRLSIRLGAERFTQ